MFVKVVKNSEYNFAGCEIGNIYEVYESELCPTALMLEQDRKYNAKRWINKDCCKTITCQDCKHYGCDNNDCNDRVKSSPGTMECFEEKDLEYYSNKDKIRKDSKTMFVKIIKNIVSRNRRFEIGMVCKVYEDFQYNFYRLAEDPEQIINKFNCEIIIEDKQNKSDKNYIAETAKMYGVEIGEQFKIQHAYSKAVYDSIYFFDNTDRVGLFIVNKPDDATSMLKYLAKGECVILKMPWKPIINEEYFYNNVREGKVSFEVWGGSTFDYAMYTLRNCYKTEELAREDRPNALKRLGVEI